MELRKITSILNTKIPSIGEILISRLINQYKLCVERNEVNNAQSKLQFIGHLTNQQVCGVLLPLQIATQLMKQKAQNVAATGADYVVTTCPACVIGLKRGLIGVKKSPKVVSLSDFLSLASIAH